LRDFVIVSSLDLELDQGFNVLTGETGAGKSILIDALQLALGARADSGVVREGAARCEIAAEFDTPSGLVRWLEEQGLQGEEGNLLLRRTVDTDGRSRGWINGSAATMAQLKGLADHLVDIHGQHAWQSLTRADAVRDLLDAYAGVDTGPALGLWGQWRQSRKALESAQERQVSLHQDSERLSWQIGELDKLQPLTGEWEALNIQHSRLANAQGLQDAARAAAQALDDDASAASLIHRALATLQSQAHLEPAFVGPVEALQAALAQVQDTVHSLHQYARHTDIDPSGLEALDQRLSQWLSLARRYRRPPEELAELLAGWKKELESIDQALDLDKLVATEKLAWKAFDKEIKRLGQQRQQAAPRLANAVTDAMQTLGMQGGRFEVALHTLEEPQAHGWEQVEFLVAGHAGVSPKPVGKVASGGELSRIALAISVVTSRLGQAPTLIFDEVDAGIGGAVAHTVGQLLRQLGHDRQVLAVTHLPQVAACGDHHLLVSKRQSGASTHSTVTAIEQEDRVRELARMLGGNERSEVSLAHARELLTA
jgi:DNA repair protein RecN (Recombination protein N)